MIERFQWTFHAEQRLAERGLGRHEIELAVRLGKHEPNFGPADWRTGEVRADGLRFVVVFDYPAEDDPGAACIVSAWTIVEGALGPYPW